MDAPVPSFARWLLRVAAASSDRDALIADLEDEAADIARTRGIATARRWSGRQALMSIAPLLFARIALSFTDSRRVLMSILRGLGSDLTLAARRLVHAPGFTLVCILTLALGIGGNTAVFTLVDRVMLKPLPVPRPHELYRLGDTDACCVNGGLQNSFSLFSYDLYTRLRDSSSAFAQVAAFQANTRAMTVGRPADGRPQETLSGAFVSGNYFQMFEVAPAMGRLVSPADDRPGAPAVAVISHRAWTTRFHSRADISGLAVTLNGVPATIAGVAPPGFYGDTLRPDAADIWVPLSNEPLLQPAARLLDARTSHWLYAIGRAKPGFDGAAVGAQLTAALHQWVQSEVQLSADDRARLPTMRVNVISAAVGVRNARDAFAPSLKLLQAIAAAVLLIACANLANLLLASGLGRRSEFAVRAALGAPRGRLIAQSLVESVLLASLGGLAGIALSMLGAKAIVDLAFRGAAYVPVDPWPSFTAVGFAVGVSLLTGLVFGAAPALVGSRPDPIEAMRAGTRSTTDRGSRLRRSLVAVQVAMSLVLVMCAALLARSLHNLQAQDFGFTIEHRYVVSLAPSLSTVPSDQLASLYPRLQERLRQIPGVRHAAFSLYAPMSGDNWSAGIGVEGHDTTERVVASWNRVSASYFETVGTPILRGRGITERDGPAAPPVAVVSATFAKRFFAGADPLGRHVRFASAPAGARPTEFEIVGVVADAKFQDGRRAPNPTFFMPFLQVTSTPAAQAAPLRFDRSHYPQAIELHAAGVGSDFEESIRRALSELDPRLTVRDMVAMDEQVARGFNGDRLLARLALAFGGAAVLLACLGLYGVTAYSVARRTREIGIRMAIGASGSRVLKTVLASAMSQLAIGVALGLPAAFLAGRYLEAQLFGVTAKDPLVIAGAVAVLGLSALVAAIVPAGRAARMNPVRALRME